MLHRNTILFISILFIPVLLSGMEQKKKSGASQQKTKSYSQEDIYFEKWYKPSFELFVRGKTEILKSNISRHPNPQILTPYLLSTACELNHGKFLEFLAKEVININAEISFDTSSESILHYACTFQSSTPQTVACILDLGADIESQDSYGDTPLHRACFAGKKDVVELLINRGANIYAKNYNEFKFTPLYMACFKNHYDIIKLLLRHGADISETYSGLNALDCAINGKNFEMIKFLLAQKCQFSNRCTTWKCTDPKILELLIGSMPELVNKPTDFGSTPLHIACFFENVEGVEILLKHNANIDARDEDEDLPIDIAISQKNTKIIRLLERHGAIQLKEREAEAAMRSLLAEVNQSPIEKPYHKITTKKKKKKNKNFKKQILITAKHSAPEPVTTEDQSSDQLVPSQPEISQELPKQKEEEVQEVALVQPVVVPAQDATMEPIVASEPAPMKPSKQKLTAKKEIVAAKQVAVVAKQPALAPQPVYEILCAKNLDWPRTLYGKARDQLLEDMKALRNYSAGLDIKQLKRRDGFRLRSGKYRIIFTKDETNKKIYIHEIGLRKNVYKKMQLK